MHSPHHRLIPDLAACDETFSDSGLSYSRSSLAVRVRSAGGGALERGLLSNPRPPDLSNQIMSPALWLPFRGLTKLSHPGKKPAQGLLLKSIGPRKIKRKRN